MGPTPFPSSLCHTCTHLRRVESDRGSVFLQCALGKTDPRYHRYPPQPVQRCAGHRARGEG